MRAALLALLCCGCAAASRAEVAGVIERQQAAWNRGDIETFMAEGYWRSPDLVFYSGGQVSKGFDNVLAGYVKRYRKARAETGHLEFSELEVVPLGPDAALARGRWDVDFAEEHDIGGLFTLVLKRIDGGWRIIHDHTSLDA